VLVVLTFFSLSATHFSRA